MATIRWMLSHKRLPAERGRTNARDVLRSCAPTGARSGRHAPDRADRCCAHATSRARRSALAHALRPSLVAHTIGGAGIAIAGQTRTKGAARDPLEVGEVRVDASLDPARCERTQGGRDADSSTLAASWTRVPRRRLRTGSGRRRASGPRSSGSRTPTGGCGPRSPGRSLPCPPEGPVPSGRSTRLAVARSHADRLDASSIAEVLRIGDVVENRSTVCRCAPRLELHP